LTAVIEWFLSVVALMVLMAWCVLCAGVAGRLAQALPVYGPIEAAVVSVATFAGLGFALWSVKRLFGRWL